MEDTILLHWDLCLYHSPGHSFAFAWHLPFASGWLHHSPGHSFAFAWHLPFARGWLHHSAGHSFAFARHLPSARWYLHRCTGHSFARRLMTRRSCVHFTSPPFVAVIIRRFAFIVRIARVVISCSRRW